MGPLEGIFLDPLSYAPIVCSIGCSGCVVVTSIRCQSSSILNFLRTATGVDALTRSKIKQLGIASANVCQSSPI